MKTLSLSLLLILFCVTAPVFAQSGQDSGGTVVEGVPASGSGGGATTPATSNLLKGTGSANGVSPATPGTDYVVPTGNITGTSSNLSGTPTLPNGVTGTTQTQGDNTNKLATDQFVSTAIAGVTSSGGGATTPATVTLLKGNGLQNGVTVAAPGVDYVVPSTLGSAAAYDFTDFQAPITLSTHSGSGPTFIGNVLNIPPSTGSAFDGGSVDNPIVLPADPTTALQAATKQYVDSHAGTTALPHFSQIIAGKGDGTAVSMPEEGITVSGSTGLHAWHEDKSAGIYDPRNPAYAGGILGSTPAAAAQAMSNQMACDLAMGVVQHATAKWPQGAYPIDNLLIAPGSDWEGTPQAEGGTQWHSIYNNHQLATAPISMTLTCSDGQSHTDSVGFTHVQHFTLVGCGTGGCTNAAGDTVNYQVAGPGNVGLNMATNGIVEHVYAENFGGYGIRMSGQDDKIFHSRVSSNDEWYLYGSYKGWNESATSTEASAITTGATGSVSLTWAAVTGAAGYVVYRGSTAGGESAFFIVGSNSYTDTGAAGGTGAVTNVVTQTTTGTPGTITPSPSTTGGTLAAGTHYYKITAITTDGWHGSIELGGLDGMADWIEAYGFFDIPTVYNYHHLADILGGGGDSHYDHLWPQLGQVGIAQPSGAGLGDVYSNVRIDFARLEGFYTNDASVTVSGGQIDGSCTGSNAVTINTGQEGTRFAGQCNQYWATGGNDNLSNVWFSDNNGFGATQKTADILSEGGSSSVRNVRGATYQFVAVEGFLAGAYWEPSSYSLTNVAIDPTYGTVSVNGLRYVNITATTPTTTWAFTNTRPGQDFYVAGGNGNVTILNDGSHVVTCSGQNINLGTISGYLHFLVTTRNTDQGYGAAFVSEVCQPPLPSTTTASSETVSYSTTPTFAVTTRSSVVTMTGNITSFTLAAGADGQEKTLLFCQNGTGGFTVTPPSNVHGFFNVGATASKCSAQHYTYSSVQSAWFSDGPGTVNE